MKFILEEEEAGGYIYKAIKEYKNGCLLEQSAHKKHFINKNREKANSYANLLLNTFVWYEEGTICFIQAVNNFKIIRRQDNDMVNVTNLLLSINIKQYPNAILKKYKKIEYKSHSKEFNGIWPILTEDPNNFISLLIQN
ncbi:hypothetical protein K502DRAFT_353514 [Neoconidiobolus thromboides FSU 785]|nr:hypothetical protein K502DRAFT_353514 [Neoconidiobolus thromboides FSU 785]